jgi:pyrroloquinoline quinone (PQQ) biosynthesis protein C
MNSTEFVRSVVIEIIEPGVERLMNGPFFSELREGRLSRRRLQGWALQQHYRNVELLKGFALLMVKYAHDPDLFGYFSYQYNEEQNHPDLTKKFGYALGLKDEDFQQVIPLFECMLHTSVTIRGMLTGSLPENRASALVNETAICRHSEEFYNALRKHYGLGDSELEFFTVHTVADKDHTARAVEILACYTKTPRDQQLVQQSARNTMQLKLGKFDGIYRGYSEP